MTTRRRVLAEPPMPTVEELKEAREEYLRRYDPRDLSYRAPMKLVELAWEGKDGLDLTDAVGALLRDWNEAYFRFRGGFSEEFLEQLDDLLNDHRGLLATLRDRGIDSFGEDDWTTVENLFQAFEAVMGKVGAAKALHLLAPRFLPIWDNKIMLGYWHCLPRRKTNAEAYCSFMEVSKRQTEQVGGEAGLGWNPLKALDEYNFVRFSMKGRPKRERKDRGVEFP